MTAWKIYLTKKQHNENGMHGADWVQKINWQYTCLNHKYWVIIHSISMQIHARICLCVKEQPEKV